MDFETALKQIPKQKEFEGYSLVSLIQIYWDESINPNGNYETELSLTNGERDFCESYGYKWIDWIEVKKLLNK